MLLVGGTLTDRITQKETQNKPPATWSGACCLSDHLDLTAGSHDEAGLAVRPGPDVLQLDPADHTADGNVAGRLHVAGGSRGRRRYYASKTELYGRDELNYYQIGQRIRKYRKAQGLSQEELAARAGISVTHMSHIETGNTKLSLPVFVELAGALGVQADELLFDRGSERGLALAELSDTLDRCTAQQLRIVTDIVKAAKASLDKYHTP